MPRTRHTHNGKLLGVFYETEGGNKIYLAHKQLRQLDRRYMGWSIDTLTLSKCRREGFLHVGVVCRRGRVTCIWLSPIDDFYEAGKCFVTHGPRGAERGLKLSDFAIDPSLDPGKIELAF